MAKFIDIISPIYQELISRCERRKISVNLDFQNITIRLSPEDVVKITTFYKTELKRALKLCKSGDKITLSQSENRFSVKNSSHTTLDAETIEKLRASGHEVRARFGYDTIISIKI